MCWTPTVSASTSPLRCPVIRASPGRAPQIRKPLPRQLPPPDPLRQIRCPLLRTAHHSTGSGAPCGAPPPELGPSPAWRAPLPTTPPPQSQPPPPTATPQHITAPPPRLPPPAPTATPLTTHPCTQGTTALIGPGTDCFKSFTAV